MNVPLTPLMFLRRSAKLHPDKTAVVCGTRRFSYRRFSGRIHRLSRFLASLGVKPGTVVAYLSRNSHRLLEAYYGVVQTGAIFLPLNMRLTAGDFRYILNHSEARLLLMEEEFLPLITEVRKELRDLQGYVLLDGEPPLSWLNPLGYEQAIEEYSPEPFPDTIRDEDAVAELFYTSGTTARPKGVMLTHRNLYLHAQSVVFALQNRETDVQLHTIPLFHANGWGATHSITCVGGTHVMLRHFRPKTVLELIQNEGVTSLNLVPTMATLLLNSQAIPNYRLDSLRLVHLGGSSVPPGHGPPTGSCFRMRVQLRLRLDRNLARPDSVPAQVAPAGGLRIPLSAGSHDRAGTAGQRSQSGRPAGTRRGRRRRDGGGKSWPEATWS